MTPAHTAVENEDLPRLRDLLDSGVDLEEVDGGLTLLQHAIDVEIDGHTQTGSPLHVGGHWLAVALIEAITARPK